MDQRLNEISTWGLTQTQSTVGRVANQIAGLPRGVDRLVFHWPASLLRLLARQSTLQRPGKIVNPFTAPGNAALEPNLG